MSRKTWVARNFRLHTDNKLTNEEVEKHLAGEKVKVSFDSISHCWELKFEKEQNWDNLIDKFLNVGIIGIDQAAEEEEINEHN